MILEVRNRRVSAVIAVENGKYEVLDCDNRGTCRITGAANRNCPAYCPLVVDAKRFARGESTRCRVDVLSTSL